MKKLIPVLLVAALVHIPVFAGPNIKVAKGDFDLTLAGSFDANTPSGSDLRIDTQVGAYIKNYWQLGPRLDFTINDDYNRMGLSVFSYYLFETRTHVLPFVGGGLGYGSLDPKSNGSKETGVEMSFYTGLKWFLAHNISLNAEFRATVSSGDTFVEDNGKGTNSDLGLLFGLSFMW